MKIAVYTTYCGTADRATAQSRIVSEKYPHYFISNNSYNMEVYCKYTGWKPILLEGEQFEVTENYAASSMQAKYAKALPHKFPELAEYDYLLYVDDKITFNVDRMEEWLTILNEKNSPLAVRNHWYLPSNPANVLNEYGESMFQQRYYYYSRYCATYIAEQVAEGYSLTGDYSYMTNIILRNMRHPEIININEEWYDHIKRSTICCQIPFHFIAQKYKNFALLDRNID